MERRRGLRRFLIVGSQNLVVAAALLGSSRLGLAIFLEPGSTSPFWPPTGVAIVALLLLGWRMWPGIMLGAVAINSLTTPAVVVVPTAMGSTLACVCAYWALCKVGFRPQIDRLKDAFALVFVAALGAMLISSSIGTGLLVVAGQVTGRSFLSTWLTWWTGDAMGVLVVAPLLLTLVNVPWRQYRHIDWVMPAEIIGLLAGSLVLLYLGQDLLGVLFLAFPLVVFAAWRYQLAGAAPIALLASALAIDAAVDGYGSFGGRDLLGRMLILQLFNGSIALTGILLSAALTERKRTREELERTCAQLSKVVQHLDQAMRPGETTTPLRVWAEQQQHQPLTRTRRSDRGRAD